MASFFHKDIELQFAKACDLHSASDFGAAEKIYISLLELLPDSSLLHHSIGLLYYETEDFDKALSHYSTARSYALHDPDILFNYALCQKKLSKVHDAITSFTEFTTICPDDPDGFYTLGNCYRELKEFEKTLTVYKHALEINPDHLPANKNLAYVYHLLGDTDNAIILYKHILNLEPSNEQARHMIAAITGEHVDQIPSEYVKEVFDHYSETFETNLLEDLHYTVPAQLRANIDTLDHSVESFYKCIDLGCGTGLAGVAFHKKCEHITGIDISEKMIAQAESKNIYTILAVAEATSFLKKKKGEYDLVIAADFLTYVGDLSSVFEAVTSATTERALFCFSIENSAQPDFHLCSTGRFAHARQYVVQTAGRHGWRCLDIKETNLRKEKTEWVEGTLYFMVKSQ